MSLQVWLPLNRDPNMTPDITSYRKESGVTLTEDTDGWYKVQDTTHASGGRWGIYYDFNVKPNTTYTLYVYSKSTTGVSARIGIQSFISNVGWSTVRDTNTGAEKLTTYTWTTGNSDTIARVYLALTPTATKANDYVFYKEPRVYEAPQNQGIANIMPTDSGALYNNNGKIGGCYFFNNNGGRIIFPYHLQNKNKFTIALWLKSPTNSFKGCSFCFESNGMWKFATYNGVLCVRDDSRTSYSAGSRYEYSLGAVTANTWTHLICSYNAGQVKIYRDGMLLSTNQTSGTTMDNYPGAIASIGADHTNLSTTDYYFSGYINDFRVYDYILSTQEIKELVRGLVLHYPLNNNGFGNENLISGTDFNNTSKKYTVTSGTEGGFTFTPTESIIANTNYVVSCRLRGNANMNLYKLCTGGNEAINWVNRNQLSTTEYKSFSIAFTYPSSKTLNQIYICTRYGSANTQAGDWFEIEPYSLKLEKGNSATPWCPNVSDTLYTKMGMNNNIVYDISGFQNNGTITGTLSTSDDTDRYHSATYFDGSSYILTDSGTFSWFDFNQCTIAAWFKSTVKPSSYSGSIGIAHNQNAAHKYFAISNYGGTFVVNSINGSAYINTTSGYVLPLNEWHHCAATLDGTVVKIYVDGVLKNTATINWNNAGIASDTRVNVGVDLPGTDEKYTGYYSDVRIYTTALSASDIQELYEMRREVN